MLKSSDQGVSFAGAVPVVGPASGFQEFNADGAVDTSNTYHLVYVEADTPTVVKYTQSADGGATWTAPVTIQVSADPQGTPQVAITPDGQAVYVCFSQGNPTTNIFLAVSQDGGASFVTSPITNDANQNSFCNVGVGPDGQVYLAYTSFQGASFDVLFRSSSDAGATFSTPVTVNSPSDNDQQRSYLSVDAFGRIDMVWGDDNGGISTYVQIMFGRSLDGGATFSATTPIVPAGAAQLVFPLGLVHDASGRLHLQYCSDANDPGVNSDIFYLSAE